MPAIDVSVSEAGTHKTEQFEGTGTWPAAFHTGPLDSRTFEKLRLISIDLRCEELLVFQGR